MTATIHLVDDDLLLREFVGDNPPASAPRGVPLGQRGGVSSGGGRRPAGCRHHRSGDARRDRAGPAALAARVFPGAGDHDAGEIVTKDQLLEAVWPGRIVTETALTNAIGKPRTAIGDDDQTIIRVAYGYRFEAKPERG